MDGGSWALSRRGLTELQELLLGAFTGVDGCWLTGGAALSGFFTHHRRSYDLDLFTGQPERLDELESRLRAFCGQHGLQVESLRRYPGFRRLKVGGLGEDTLVDLVWDQAPQLIQPRDKPVRNGLRIESLRELRANKLAAILGRGETKDLVDLFVIEQQGLPAIDGLQDALTKDSAIDPSTLAWVLSEISLDTSSLLMESDLDTEELGAFRDRLVQQLQRLAWPS